MSTSGLQSDATAREVDQVRIPACADSVELRLDHLLLFIIYYFIILFSPFYFLFYFFPFYFILLLLLFFFIFFIFYFYFLIRNQIKLVASQTGPLRIVTSKNLQYALLVTACPSILVALFSLSLPFCPYRVAYYRVFSSVRP